MSGRVREVVGIQRVPLLSDWGVDRFNFIDRILRGCGVELLPWQRRFMCDRSRIKQSLLARRAGKSVVMACELYIHPLEMLSLGIEPRMRLSAPRHDQLGLVLSELKKMCELGGTSFVDNSSNLQDCHVKIDRYRIDLRITKTEDAQRGAGLTLHAVDESSLIDGELYWKAISPTFVDMRGRHLLMGSPDGRNWCYEYALSMGAEPRDYELRELYVYRNPAMSYSFYQGGSWLNEYIDVSEWERARSTLPSHIFLQEHGGACISTYGHPFPVRPRIVSGWSEEVFHHARWCVGIDDGTLAPWCALLVAKCLDGVYRVVEEEYSAGVGVHEKAMHLLRWRNYPGIVYCADPTLWNSDGRESVPDIWGRYDIPLRAGPRGRKEGWRLIRTLCNPPSEWRDRWGVITDRPNLLEVHESCSGLISEINGARAKRHDPEDIEHPEHALSALRYALDELVTDRVFCPEEITYEDQLKSYHRSVSFGSRVGIRGIVSGDRIGSWRSSRLS